MNLLDPEVFFLRHLPLHFTDFMSEGFNNTSAASWLDVDRPINLYKYLTEFLTFLRGKDLAIQPKILLLLLDKHFILAADQVLGTKVPTKEANQIGRYILGELPQVSHTN